MERKFSRILLSVLLTLVLAFSVTLAAAAADAPTIMVEKANVAPGETVTVGIYLQNNPGITSARLNVGYDAAALKLTGIAYNLTEMGGQAVYPENLDSMGGQVTLYWTDSFKDYTGDCMLAELTFAVSADVEPGETYDLTVSYNPDDIYNVLEDNVTFEVTSGSITVIDCIPGDINGDRVVNTKDATRLMRYYANWNVEVNAPTLDVNGDGSLNTKDTTRLMRYLANWDVEIFCACSSSKECKHTMTAVDEKAATCTEKGNIGYWYCGTCQKYFADSQGKTEITLADTVTPAAGHGILTHNAPKDPTCTEPGNEEYWYCGTCNGFYADAEGKTAKENVFLAAKEHSFSDEWVSDDTYHWHTAICEHTDVISAKVRHTFENDVCTVCKYDASLSLEAPTNVHVVDDVIYWTAVPNAKSYTVVANDIYKVTGFEGTSCPVDFLTYKVGDEFKTISKHGIISVKVMAEESGNYKASDWSKVCNDYYYIPDSADTATIEKLRNYGLGRPYNFVEDPNLDIDQMGGLNVLNPAKLLSICSYTEEKNTDGYSQYYNYSSVDEYMAKYEGSFAGSIGVDIPMAGTLDVQLSANETSQFKNYAYNEMFVTEVGITLKDHRIIGLYVGENGTDNDALIACMDPKFLSVIKGETTHNLSNEELAAIIYDDYGTHVVLGVTSGGSYLAQYTISTNDEAVADTVKTSTKYGGGIDVENIIKVDIGLESSSASKNEWSNSTTEAHFNVTWRGSTGGAVVSPDQLQSAVDNFSAGLTPETATPLRLAIQESNQTPSAIAISDLIRAVDSDLADAFDAYIDAQSNDSYEDLYKKYDTSLTRLVSAPTVEKETGKNVLTVDLSAYQKGGSLESAYDPNFVDGILELHPVMYTKRIDKIVLRGAFDEEAKRNLIDSITVALPKEWNGRTLEIVIENLGAVATADCGILDLSAISNDAGITVSYTGINVIQGTDGLYTCYADGKAYALELKADEKIDFSTASVSGGVTLPVATKANYDFAGWIDGNENMVTASNGKLNTDVQFGTDVPLLSATWKPITYKLTLNEQGATQSGTKQLSQMYGISYTLEDSETEDIAKQNAVSQITVPVKTGYVFGGYYSAVPENNSTVNVKDQGEKYIDASGNIIVSNMTLTDAKTVYAKWTPAQYTIEYIGNGATEGTTAKSVHRYDVEAKLTKLGYKKEAASFGGWNTKADGTGTTYANEATVKNLTSVDGGVVKLYAIWTDNIVVTLNAPDAENSYTKNVYMTPAKDAIYNDVNCTEKLEVISKPALTGYTFGGFYDSVENNKTYNPTGTNQRINKEGKFVSIPENDFELVAMWDLNEYTASWEDGVNCIVSVGRIASPLANAKLGGITSGATVYYGDVLTIAYYIDHGYEVASKGETSVTVTGNVTSTDIYVTAKPKIFTINYNLNKASADTSTTSTQCYEDLSFSKTTGTITYGTSYTLDVPTAKYYTFEGWYTSGGIKITDANGKSVYMSSSMDGMTVYAHWTKTMPDYQYLKTASNFYTYVSQNPAGKFLIIKDINLSERGSFATFSGVLDGGGNTITGWNQDLYSNKIHGLIRTNSGTIRNLTISGATLCGPITDDDKTHDHDISGEHKAGLLCGVNNGTIDNVKIINSKLYLDVGSMSNDNDNYAYGGLICGYNTGTVTNSEVSSSYINVYAGTHYQGARAYVGGLIGYSVGGKVTSCSSMNNKMYVTVKADWNEGIFGRCKSHGRPYLYVAGVIGYAQSTSYSGLSVSGNSITSTLERGCGCSTNEEHIRKDTVAYSG